MKTFFVFVPDCLHYCPFKEKMIQAKPWLKLFKGFFLYWTYILYTFIDHKLPRYLKTFTKSVEPSARTVKQNIKCIFFNSPKVPQYNLFSRNHATSSTVTSKNPGIHKEKLLRKQKRSFTSSLLHKAKLCECLLMKKKTIENQYVNKPHKHAMYFLRQESNQAILSIVLCLIPT